MSELDNLLESMHRSFLDEPGEPYCARCWYEVDFASLLELNENGDFSCSNCGMVGSSQMPDINTFGIAEKQNLKGV